MKLIVVGSINMDVVNRVHAHPLPGETVNGIETVYNSGGKGANQAVAASLSGAGVTMIGAVGTDVFADELTDSLNNYHVDAGYVLRKEGTSGMAFITVDAAGENSIILSKGANGKLLPDDLPAHRDLFKAADALLLQNEIPWETTRYAMKLARHTETVVFFNPAPAMAVPDEALADIDWLVLNELEAEAISGLSVADETSALKGAHVLLNRGVSRVVLTMGEKGAVYVDKQGGTIRVPAFRVAPVDTTAAGDTFIGTLAAAVLQGHDTKQALMFASAAAAITVTRKGAQHSIPRREEIERFLQQQS
jgi:ribokinase